MAQTVQLKLYDLSGGLASMLSLQLLGKKIDGVWHTGVVVGGQEYFFGQGIQCCPSHNSPFGSPVDTITMGQTEIPDEMLQDFLQDVAPRFNAATYDLLNNNCNNFSNELCEFLVGKNIPEYITGLPQEVQTSPMGAQLLAMLQPALQNRLGHATATGFGPGTTPVASSIASAAPSTQSAPATRQSTSNTSNAAAPQAAPPDTADKGTSGKVQQEQTASASTPPKREDYNAALQREFQRVKAQGVQDANRAAAEALRRVAELVQSGAVMPPQQQRKAATAAGTSG